MKNRFARLWIIPAALIFVACALSGCKGAPDASADAPSFPTPPGSGSGTVSIPVSSFNLTTDFSTTSNPKNNSNIVTYLHRASTVNVTDADWTNPCEIQEAVTDTNQKYITCNLEVNELDLWFNSFELNWGAAPGMCAYVEVHPYWFFQYPADIHATANNVSVAYTVTDGGPPVFDAGGDAGGLAQMHNNKVNCAFDYSWESPIAGPNCCEGTYSLTVKNCTTNPLTCTSSTSTQNWGGFYGSCAAGPAAEQDWGARDSVHKFPVGKIYAAYPGVAQALPITAPGANPAGILITDTYSANYVKNVTPLSLVDLAFIQPSYGHYYSFVCLDNNREAIAWINLNVRKWNTYSEMLKLQAGDPTVNGPETPFPGNKLDYFGWDDFKGNAIDYPGLGL